MIRDFSRAFQRPVNESWADNLPIADRELLGKLLLEEVTEYLVKGLGLTIMNMDGETVMDIDGGGLMLEHNEGVQLNPVEIVDGLADVNVVIHFNAHWHGFNLDAATEIVNDSNMSKLGPDGQPIINGVTRGYRTAEACGEETVRWRKDFAGEEGFDPNKPIGKILKGPDFYEPGPLLSQLIMSATGNCEDEGCPHNGQPHGHGESANG
jgi:predicted HAD superfamily Cof-like phosphohydrolase